MADVARLALGLSMGATNLAAVTADRAVTRKPVLTQYRQRPPEVGVPSENPKLNEPGLVITDFVDRVGDPVGIVAAVSMNTAENRNIARFGGSCATLISANLDEPKRPMKSGLGLPEERKL